MRFFGRLERYVWAELQAPFLLGLAGFTFSILLTKLFDLVGKLFDKKVPTSVMLGLLANELPGILLLTLPIATVLSVLAGIGRMASQSEITAFRAAGISPLRVFLPVVLFAGFTTGFATWVAQDLAPGSIPRRKALIAEVQRGRDPAREIEPGTFYMRLPGAVFYARSAVETSQGRVFEGVFLHAESGEINSELIVAARARIIFDRDSGKISLLLDDGEQHVPPKEPGGVYHRIRFPRLTRSFPADVAFSKFTQGLPTPMRSARWGDLPKEIHKLRAELRNATRKSKQENLTVELRRAQIEWYRRLALPLGGLVLAFASFPLAAQSKRGGRFSGLSQCLVLLLVYYVVLIAAEGPTEKGSWPPWLGPFLPVIAFAIFGAMLWLGVLSGSRLFTPVATVWDSVLQIPRRAAEWWRHRRLNKAVGPQASESHVLQRIEIQERRQAAPRMHGPFDLVDRYLAINYLRLFFAVVLSLSFMGFIVEFKAGFDDVPAGARNIPWLDIVTFSLLTIPGQLRYLLPLAALFGAAIALAGLARNGEIVALKAAGIGPVRMALPLLGVTAFLSLVYGVAQETLIPTAERIAERAKETIAGRRGADPADSGRRWLVGDDGRIWSFLDWDPSKERLLAPFVVEADLNRGEVESVLSGAMAQHGLEGWTWTKLQQQLFVEGSRDAGSFVSSNQTVFQYSEAPELFGGGSESLFGRREADQMSAQELRRSVAILSKTGSPVGALRVRLHERLVTPLLPILLMPVGIALIVTGWSRKTSLFGFVIALAVAIAFWSTWAVTTSLGREGLLSPLIATWSVPILLGASGALLLTRAR
ncbi:MAG: LptF/LptG family permease [Acidobacteriota bacterium]